MIKIHRTLPNRSFLDPDYQPFTYQLNGNDVYSYTYVIHCIPTDQYYAGQRTTKKFPLYDNYTGSGTKLKQLKNRFDWFKDFEVTIIQCYNSLESVAIAESELILQTKQRYGEKCINVHSNKQITLAGRLLSENHKLKLKQYRSDDQYRQDQRDRCLKYRQQHPEVTKFYSQMMSEKWNDEEFRQKMEKIGLATSIKAKQEFKNNPNKIFEIPNFYKGQPVIALNDFVSPLNGKSFKAGTVFKSCLKASKLLGFSHERSFVNSISGNKKHPWKWYSKINNNPTFICEFSYVSNLSNEQMKRFNIESDTMYD